MHTTAPTRKELRDFGLVMAAAVALLFGLLFPWLRGHPLPWWPWAVAALFLLPALAAPRLLAPLRRGWLAVGEVVGKINTRIILAAAYLLIILPVGLAMRLGRDPLARRFDPAAASYRLPRKRGIDKSSLERPF